MVGASCSCTCCSGACINDYHCWCSWLWWYFWWCCWRWCCWRWPCWLWWHASSEQKFSFFIVSALLRIPRCAVGLQATCRPACMIGAFGSSLSACPANVAMACPKVECIKILGFPQLVFLHVPQMLQWHAETRMNQNHQTVLLVFGLHFLVWQVL